MGQVLRLSSLRLPLCSDIVTPAVLILYQGPSEAARKATLHNNVKCSLLGLSRKVKGGQERPPSGALAQPAPQAVHGRSPTRRVPVLAPTGGVWRGGHWQLALGIWLSVGVMWAPSQGTSGNVWSHIWLSHPNVTTKGSLLACSGQKLGMLPHIPQCTGQSPTTKNDPVRKASGTQVSRPCCSPCISRGSTGCCPRVPETPPPPCCSRAPLCADMEGWAGQPSSLLDPPPGWGLGACPAHLPHSSLRIRTFLDSLTFNYYLPSA